MNAVHDPVNLTQGQYIAEGDRPVEKYASILAQAWQKNPQERPFVLFLIEQTSPNFKVLPDGTWTAEDPVLASLRIRNARSEAKLCGRRRPAAQDSRY